MQVELLYRRIMTRLVSGHAATICAALYWELCDAKLGPVAKGLYFEDLYARFELHGFKVVRDEYNTMCNVLFPLRDTASRLALLQELIAKFDIDTEQLRLQRMGVRVNYDI